MLIGIAKVPSTEDVCELRGINDASPWVEGNETTVHQSRLANKEQLARVLLRKV
ncbi:MAG: hypothetical protein ACK5NN_07390 [Sphingomonadaceae bacterium]